MKKYELMNMTNQGGVTDIKLSEFEELNMIFGFPTKEEEDLKQKFNRFISEGGVFQ